MPFSKCYFSVVQWRCTTKRKGLPKHHNELKIALLWRIDSFTSIRGFLKVTCKPKTTTTLTTKNTTNLKQNSFAHFRFVELLSCFPVLSPGGDLLRKGGIIGWSIFYNILNYIFITTLLHAKYFNARCPVTFVFHLIDVCIWNRLFNSSVAACCCKENKTRRKFATLSDVSVPQKDGWEREDSGNKFKTGFGTFCERIWLFRKQRWFFNLFLSCWSYLYMTSLF